MSKVNRRDGNRVSERADAALLLLLLLLLALVGAVGVLVGVGVGLALASTLSAGLIDRRVPMRVQEGARHSE